MVHEVMSTKKLDFKGIYSGEICPMIGILSKQFLNEKILMGLL